LLTADANFITSQSPASTAAAMAMRAGYWQNIDAAAHTLVAQFGTSPTAPWAV